MAALPNGRVGGGTRASSSPARPPARVDRSAPQVPRALPGRRRAPPGPAPLLSPFLSGFALSSSPAVPAQHLAASLWQTEGLDLRPTLVFVLRPSSAAAVEAAKPPTPPGALFYYHPFPQHCHWRVWAKPPPFRLRWRNVPGTRRNERTGVGLHGNWKKEVGYKSIATLL